MIIKRPSVKPDSAFFSSGPCAKRPGWSISNLPTFTLGRSHRSKIAKDKLKELITLSKSLLKLPNDYKVGIVAGSDTGAIEMAMWSLLGATGVDILGWENFGNDWVKDAVSQLKIKNLNVLKADYGKLPDLTKVDFNNDVVFTWNGTSSGVCLPDWQKVLGGEGGHGMIALSPKALERLRTYQPSWPIPKIFRLAEDKKVLEGVFEGETINTPSMLCVEDCVDALLWIQSIGGSEGAIKRSKKNLEEVKFFVKENKDWIDFLAEKENTISSTSICLKITDPNFKKLSKEDQTTKLKTINQILEKENIAYDVNSYRTAPAGFRIWGGATVESTDIEKLLPWIKWAYLTNLNV